MWARLIHQLIFLSFVFSLNGQADSARLNYTARKLFVGSAVTLVSGASFAYLHHEWYAPYKGSSFHYFNDNGEWLQMDKLGHAYSSYQGGRLMMEAFQWAGFSKKYCLAAGAYGALYMTGIEIMDGYSSGWGFSLGDEVADFAGAGLAISQQAAWSEQRVLLKFSYWPSGLAKYNPALLGDDSPSRVLKDYNGQTYWLSVGPAMFSQHKSAFPRWLNFCAGYGANGMIGGFENNKPAVDKNGNPVKFERTRSLYLSLDINLSEIRTKSRFLKTLLSIVNVLKFPAPAVEFNSKGVKFYPVYY
jgi:hypothetical protein